MLDIDIRNAIDEIYEVAKSGDYHKVTHHYSRTKGKFDIEVRNTGLVIKIEGRVDNECAKQAIEYATTLILDNISGVNQGYYRMFPCSNCVITESKMEGYDTRGNYHIKK